MPSDLFLGSELKTGGAAPFQMAGRALQAHTCITGCSGCGKTTLVARYCEEVLLRSAGNIVFFDFNHEFSRFGTVNAAAFNEPVGESGLCDEDKLPDFQESWKTLANDIVAVSASQIRVPFKNTDPERVAHLLGIRPYEDAGAFWMIRLLMEDKSLSAGLESWDDLRKRFRMFARWAEGRRKASDPGTEALAFQFETLTQRLDHARLRNALDNATTGELLAFVDGDGPRGCVLLDDKFFENLFSGTRFTSLDLLNFRYDQYRTREFVMLHVLRCIWDKAKDRFRVAKERHDEPDPPVFVVIDEAHNLVREQNPGPITDMVETIAAEGRKFKLFLVLLTQRPDKINKRVFSECENFVVMKSTPQVVAYFHKELGLDQSLDATEVRRLERGQAFFHGEFTQDEKKLIAGGFRRTAK